MNLSVAGGGYGVRLGDSAEAPPIGSALLRGTTSPKLRIWFERDDKNWAVAGPDVSLTINRPGGAGAGIEPNQAAAILAELRQIHAMLDGKQRDPRPSEPTVATVSIAGAPSLGHADAPLVLVEYTDFQCPFCTKFETETFGELKKRYVDTGKLRVVSRPLPLPMHPFAMPAARAAFCATRQHKFWEMRDSLFSEKGALAAETIRHAAEKAGLNLTELDACTAAKESELAVQKEVQQANAAGFTGTPTFVVGKANNDKVTGAKITGAVPLAYFAAEIDKQLAPAKSP